MNCRCESFGAQDISYLRRSFIKLLHKNDAFCMTRGFLRLAMGSSIDDSLAPDTLRILCSQSCVPELVRYLETVERYQRQDEEEVLYRLKCKSKTCTVWKQTALCTKFTATTDFFINSVTNAKILIMYPPVESNAAECPTDPQYGPLEGDPVSHVSKFASPHLVILCSDYNHENRTNSACYQSSMLGIA